MATVLENYLSQRKWVEGEMAQAQVTPAHVWWYTELIYRISVLETCQMLCRTAPISVEVKVLLGHYQMVDAYIKCMVSERAYGPDRGPDTQKERDAAQANLERVVQDYRKRFSSFAPSAPDFYGKELSKVVNTVLPAWLQFRNTFVPLKKMKEGPAS